MNPTSVERRFSLDSNILVYAADQDADAIGMRFRSR